MAAVLYGVEATLGTAALAYGARHEHVELDEAVFFGSWILAFALYVFGSIGLRQAVVHAHRAARPLAIARIVLAVPALLGAALGVAFFVLVAGLGSSSGVGSTRFDDVVGWMLLTLPLVVLVGEIATIAGAVRFLRRPKQPPSA